MFLTDKFANRNIILSLRCLMGEAVSPERAMEFCEGLGAAGTPFEVAFVERWVMGLVPCHALGGGGFLGERIESAVLAGTRNQAGKAVAEGCIDKAGLARARGR